MVYYGWWSVVYLDILGRNQFSSGLPRLSASQPSLRSRWSAARYNPLGRTRLLRYKRLITFTPIALPT